MSERSAIEKYSIIKSVAKSNIYNLYLCQRKIDGREYLLQIATDIGNNGALQRAAYILKELEGYAAKLEEEYEKVKTDNNSFLNYQLGFPELMDSFICDEQGGRQVNILTFRNVERMQDMIPLINITAKDRLRIDLRTSAWIMGKALKLLSFVYDYGIFPGRITGDKILINIQEYYHYVVLYDWTKAQITEITKEMQSLGISQVAKAVIITLGGNIKTGSFPESAVDGFKDYIDFLLEMARGYIGNAEKAHKTFYEIVDRTWKREFYPFTSYPLTIE